MLPTFGLPEAVKDYAENFVVHQSVGELEGMLNDGSEGFQKRWPHEFVMLSQEATRLANGMILTDAYQPIPRSRIVGVLDNVKNKLLDFVLGLQELDVPIDGQGEGSIPTGAVRNLVNINIYGDHNVVAGGENVHQEVSTIQRGDLPSLIEHFRQCGMDDEDLEELESAVSSEPAAATGAFGPKVNSWIGRMIMKATSGIWNVGVAIAPTTLREGLNHFYGV